MHAPPNTDDAFLQPYSNLAEEGATTSGALIGKATTTLPPEIPNWAKPSAEIARRMLNLILPGERVKPTDWDIALKRCRSIGTNDEQGAVGSNHLGGTHVKKGRHDLTALGAEATVIIAARSPDHSTLGEICGEEANRPDGFWQRPTKMGSEEDVIDEAVVQLQHLHGTGAQNDGFFGIRNFKQIFSHLSKGLSEILKSRPDVFEVTWHDDQYSSWFSTTLVQHTSGTSAF